MNFKYCILFAVTIVSSFQAAAQQSAWKTDKDGWALRKAPGKTKYEKFFAIGIWGVPGYKYFRKSANHPDDNKKNEEIFLSNSSDFNIVITQTDYQRPFMTHIIKAVGTAEFPWSFAQYLNRELKGRNAYARMQHLKQINGGTTLTTLIDRAVDSVSNAMRDGDYIWSPIDEVANGLGWNWPVNVVESIYRSIKKKEPENLVYTDLMGTGKGNTFLFESRYLQTNSAMPEMPPYHLLKKEELSYQKDSLLGFNQAYDGSPQYEFKNNSFGYKQYDLPTLKRLWFENVKQTAAGYKNGGDVFGVNAFLDFSQFPALAGLTVDAVKAGTGKSTPVWLYFDGNGYARGKNSIANYTRMVKCQIYTSIIHGATGIMFWSDLTKDVANFNELVPVVRDVKKNHEIFKMKTKDFHAEGDLHYVVKKKGFKKYLIASNTSKTEKLPFTLSGKKYVLNPLEVHISRL